jgi:hypothetical protein
LSILVHRKRFPSLTEAATTEIFILLGIESSLAYFHSSNQYISERILLIAVVVNDRHESDSGPVSSIPTLLPMGLVGPSVTATTPAP